MIFKWYRCLSEFGLFHLLISSFIPFPENDTVSVFAGWIKLHYVCHIRRLSDSEADSVA